MAKLLGIDTGGTFTDAVLYDGEAGVLAKAKALTTKHDLAQGIGAAMAKVLPADSGEVGLVSLSTTLATNALVEGQGGPVGLVLIGYPPKALERGGLREALGDDPVVFVAGGHTPEGEARIPLDREAVLRAAQEMQERVSAFAVAGFFAVRNPSHELAAREILREETGLPITCAHELSAGLDAPRRALTALLNARLIPLIQHLIEAVQGLMQESGLDAPLMVVKGDGSLVSDTVALTAPVETILSGPAASLVGARALASAEEVLVSDMGGTTTDIALLRQGRPVLSEQGATVGGYRTMVEAISVHTLGLGGDSEVCAEAAGRFTLGPRRAVPLSLLAERYPYVLELMDQQAEAPFPHTGDGRFLMQLRSLPESGRLKPAEAQVWEALMQGPRPFEEIARDYLSQRVAARLIHRGLLILSSFTPSDAAHHLGHQSEWEVAGALKGAHLLARQLGLDDGRSAAEAVFQEVAAAGAEALVLAGLAEEGEPASPHVGFGRHLLDRAIGRKRLPNRLLRPRITLTRPVVGIGAPAATYYPSIAERLETTFISPEHAEVCNAVGAVASGIIQRQRLLITQTADGLYRVHLPDGTKDFLTLEEAATLASAVARAKATALAREAGAEEAVVEVERADSIVPDRGGQPTFLESVVTATAVGRPRLAEGVG